MYINITSNNLEFPHPSQINRYGILSIGGDLIVNRLMLAYAYGIFPWYNYKTEPIIWWCPSPRYVIFPKKVKIAKSIRSYFNQKKFTVTFNQCFEAVIRNCEMVNRKGQKGTWINEDIIESYTQLHERGYATSVEVWEKDELVGGLYGVQMGKIFFGESMFSHKSNASKFAFISLAQKLEQEGFFVIDCQQPNPYLESLGGEHIAGVHFWDLLKVNRMILLQDPNFLISDNKD